MVNRTSKEEKQGRVKLGKLELNKETIKDLTDNEAKNIRGAVEATPTNRANPKCEKDPRNPRIVE